MKKLFFAAASLLAVSVFGQRVGKGDVQLNGGVAMDRYAGSAAFYAGADYGIHPDISIGAEARFGTKDYSYGNNPYKGTWFGIGVNGNYHFNKLFRIPEKFDVYAGLTVGLNSFKYDNSNWVGYTEPYASGVGISAQAGARYYFTDSFGVNVEANGGTLFNGAKAGVSFKF